MTFKTGTIRLAAAREIFSGVTIEEIKVGDSVVGYKALMDGKSLEDKALTKLCKMLWEARWEKI